MKWSDITLKQYFELMDSIKDVQDPLIINSEMIRIIFNIEMNGDLPWSKYTNYLEQLSFLKDPYKPKNPSNYYVIGGIKFKTCLNINEITTAQYIDFQELTKRGDNKNILNCFFIKDGENYGDSDYSDLLWNNLTVDIYSDVMFFFINLLKTLMQNTLIYSKKTLMKMVKKEKNRTKKISLLKKLITLQIQLSRLNEDGLFE